MVSEKTKSILGITIILGLFILSSYLVKQNLEFLQNLIGGNYYGLLIYVFIGIFAVVFAPVSMMPLVPIASNVYGFFLGAFATWLGWILGSIIAFIFARKYGVKLIQKIISLKEIYKWESKIPKENMFVNILLLRMVFPVDILSYALGILSKVNFKTYLLATAIGIVPFTIIFSYLGMLPTWYQITGIIIVVFLIATIHFFRELKNN
ncbi:MAG: VTT domain-containing protein [Candidatus Pacearchaeota archaeon]